MKAKALDKYPKDKRNAEQSNNTEYITEKILHVPKKFLTLNRYKKLCSFHKNLKLVKVILVYRELI